MRIKFYAKPDHCVHAPGPKQAGQLHNYLGRVFVLETDDKVAQFTRVAGQNRATEDGFSVESNSPEGQYVIAEARLGGLYCADQETAQLVGVEFVKLKFDAKAFEWFPDSATVASSSSRSTAQSE